MNPQHFLKISGLLCLLLTASFHLWGQSSSTNNHFGCGYDTYFEQHIASDNDRLEAYQQYERFLQKKIKRKKQLSTQRFPEGLNEYVIPVVVHLIYNDDFPQANISNAQIQSQIDAMNDAFQGNNPNTDIRFCLAKNSLPDGLGNTTPWTNLAEPGIMHWNLPGSDLPNNLMTADVNDQMLAITHPNGNNIFPFERYLNIWVVNTINEGVSAGTTLGYAPTPILTGAGNFSVGNIDGVIIRSDVFGSNANGGSFNLYNNFDEGKTMAHEVGHYLFLLHTFQNGCNGVGDLPDDVQGDRVPDTAPVPEPSATVFNCDSFDDCNGNTLNVTNNHMFYAVDECRNRFSPDQITRMQTFIDEGRANLVSLENLILTGLIETGGCVEPFPSAIFEVSSSWCIGTSINFQAQLTGANNSATTWSWDMGDGIGSSTNPETVDYTYNEAGAYTITLLVTDNLGNQDSYSLDIFVSACNLEDPTKAHWFFGDFCSVDFSNGNPVATLTALNNGTMQEGFEPITGASDENGNLLFYANHYAIWDRNHTEYLYSNVVPGLLIPASANAHSAAQMLAIPAPEDPNSYYVILSPGNSSSDLVYEYYKLTVNTDGSLTFTESDILPLNLNVNYIHSEKITAIQHCNGKDYWLILSLDAPGANTKFAVLRLSENGFTNNDFSSIGADLYPTDPDEFYIGAPATVGRMKASPDGSHFATTANMYGQSPIPVLPLYDFDNTTGIVSSETILYNGGGTYGISFSPNSEYLYARINTDIVQFELSSGNSQVVVTQPVIGDFQLGPDNRIYVACMNTNVQGLVSIENPDDPNPIANTNAVPLGILDPDITVRPGLPNFIDAKVLDADPLDFTWEFTNCTEISLDFDIGCWDHYELEWDFGDGVIIGPEIPSTIINEPSTTGTFQSPVHTYQADGIYTITLTLFIDGEATTESFSQEVEVLIGDSPSISGPSPICVGELSTYSITEQTGFTYSWTISGGEFNDGQSTATGTIVNVYWTTPTVGTLSVTAIHPSSNCPNLTSNLSVEILPEPCDLTTCETSVTLECLDNGNVLGTLYDANGNLITLGNNETIEWEINGQNPVSNQNPYEFDGAGLSGTVTYQNTYCSNENNFTAPTCNIDCPDQIFVKIDCKFPEATLSVVDANGNLIDEDVFEITWFVADMGFPPSNNTITVVNEEDSYYCVYVRRYDDKGNLLCEEKVCGYINCVSCTSPNAVFDQVNCAATPEGTLAYDFEIHVWDPNGIGAPFSAASWTGLVDNVNHDYDIPNVLTITGTYYPFPGQEEICIYINFADPTLCTIRLCEKLPDCKCAISNETANYPDCINIGEEFCFTFEFDYYGPNTPIQFYLDQLNSSNGWEFTGYEQINPQAGMNVLTTGHNMFKMCFVYNGACLEPVSLFFDGVTQTDCKIWEMHDFKICKDCEVSCKDIVESPVYTPQYEADHLGGYSFHFINTSVTPPGWSPYFYYWRVRNQFGQVVNTSFSQNMSYTFPNNNLHEVCLYIYYQNNNTGKICKVRYCERFYPKDLIEGKPNRENPTADQLLVFYHSSAQKVVLNSTKANSPIKEIQLYQVDGKYLGQQLNPDPLSHWDMKTYAPGMYFFKLIDKEGNHFTKRIMVIKD